MFNRLEEYWINAHNAFIDNIFRSNNMKYGILGTGMVGQALAAKLIALGHEVKMGAREANNPKAAEFAAKHGARASHGTFADAAKFGEVILHATKGETALAVLQSAGANNLADKVLVDISNPLQFHENAPPTLSVVNTDSLAEQIQRALPQTHVVKTLNTMFCGVMVNPGILPQATDVFVSGNDASAKAKVISLLKSFGWQEPIDLGDITTARGTEQLLPLWVRLWGTLGKAEFNFKVVR
jgi:8-hydroxy-5-deazaflavin:NADPH oxidoreductase